MLSAPFARVRTILKEKHLRGKKLIIGIPCISATERSEIALTGSEILAKGESEIIRLADSEITAAWRR